MNAGRIFKISALLAMALAPRSNAASGLKTVWQLQLKKLLPQRPLEWDNYGVWGLGFSRDESKLAIGFGYSASSVAIQRRLALVKLNDPTEALKLFEVRFDGGYNLPEFTTLNWSPDDRYIAISERSILLLDTSTGAQCSIEGNHPSFLSTTELLVDRDRSIAKVGIDCKDLLVRALPKVEATLSPSRRDNAGTRALVIPNGLEKTTTAEVPAGFLPLEFSEDRAVSCGTEQGILVCIDLDGGSKLVTTVAAAAGSPGKLQIRAQAGRILATGSRCTVDHRVLDFGGTCRAGQRVVWDLKTKSAVAKYNPEEVSVKPPHLEGHSVRLRFAADLSPGGTFLADGSSDSVALYRVGR